MSESVPATPAAKAVETYRRARQRRMAHNEAFGLAVSAYLRDSENTSILEAEKAVWDSIASLRDAGKRTST